jgi:NADH dehydrogenase
MDRPSNGRARRLLITGASGYIGRRLVHAALARGFEVVATVRDPRRMSEATGLTVRAFDLTRPDEAGTLVDGVDSVIHLAAIIAESSRPAGADEDLNVSGTRRLLDSARRGAVRRFVFLSSQSAAEDSPTDYGRSKWEIEQMLTGDGECSVRTGLVSGGPPRGVYGVLFRLTRRLPVIPFIRPGAPVYPIHVDDVCEGLLSLVEDGPAPPRLLRLAARESVTFGAYVRTLAARRLGRRIRLLPIPARLVLLLSRMTEILPFLPTVSGERVRGLMALRPMDSAAIPAPPGAPVPRDVFDALDREGRRRRLLSEGQRLTRYVLGRRAPRGVLVRYVRALLAEQDHEPIDPPGSCLLRLTEPVFAARDDRLRLRLAIATRIVEMTPDAAPLFHNYRARPRWLAWLTLVWIVAVEAVFLPTRWIATRLKTGRRS